MENDWMSWKFAVESKAYWQDILRQTENKSVSESLPVKLDMLLK
jgi:hypothetical protein